MRYKSQAGNPLLIFVVGVLILLPFLGSAFSFVPKSFLVIVGIVLFFLIIASRLQWYEIKDDRIVGRQVIKMEIPFASIKRITILDQTSNIRLRTFRPNAVKANFQLAKSALNASLSSDTLSQVTADMDAVNKISTVAKMKLPITTAVVFISTDTGEIRILPRDTGKFIEELSVKFRENQRRELSVDTKGITL